MSSKQSTTRSGRRMHRLAAACMAVVAVSVSSGVQAEWHVRDDQARDRLRSIDNRIGDGNVNQRLRQIYEQQRISQFQSENENTKAAEAPEVELDKDEPSAQVTMTEESRCPSPGTAAPPIAQQQWELCKEVYKTERAQYQYSVAMFELTKKRQQYLDQLKQQRAGFGADDTGKLHDNTNRVLLLMSQMEIDRQQQRTYMDAYAARIAYLDQMSKTMSRKALEGGGESSNPLGSFVSGLAGGIALEVALDAAQSSKRHSF